MKRSISLVSKSPDLGYANNHRGRNNKTFVSFTKTPTASTLKARTVRCVNWRFVYKTERRCERGAPNGKGTVCRSGTPRVKGGPARSRPGSSIILRQSLSTQLSRIPTGSHPPAYRAYVAERPNALRKN